MAGIPTPGGFEGEALVLWDRLGRILVAVHYTRSSVGPFVEVAGIGVRPWPRRRTLAVGAQVRPTAAANGHGTVRADDLAELAGTKAATLKWWVGGRWRELLWEERGLRLRAGVGRTGLPARVPSWLLHPATREDARGEDGAERLPARLYHVRIEVEVPEDDPLAVFAGNRPGVLISTAASVGRESSWLPRLLPRVLRTPRLAEPA